jgi:hypothetical protein
MIIVNKKGIDTMTNKKYFNLWEEFRAEMYGCRPDENGNCPCDYGMLCDRCQTDEACELFKQWRENKAAIKPAKGYRIHVTDTATYEFDDKYTREEAVELALEWFAERKPCIMIEELR